MESSYIKYPHSTFHYRKYGNGANLLFCFHGYGRESSVFYFFEKLLGKQYTVIAIDLPFHGATTWDRELTFHPDYLIQVIQEIRATLMKEAEKFSLLGFSMGGRVALHLAQVMYSHIDRLILIAPDGLRLNFWNYIATHTWAGNKLLKYTVKNPSWFLQALKLAEKTKWVHKSVTSFVHYYMDNATQRQVLYQRWTTMRKFSPNLARMKRLINKHRIKTRMMFGQHDNIIPMIGGKKFLSGIEDNASMCVVNLSHHLLNEGNASRILKLFND